MGGNLFIFLFSVLLFSICKTQDGIPPVITQGPGREYLFAPGSTIPLVCEAEGVPKPSYAWYKDGMRMDCNNPRYTCVDDKILSISSADENDIGIYECSAFNSYGSTMSDLMNLRMYSVGPGNSDVFKYDTMINNGQRMTCNAPYSVPGINDKGYGINSSYPTFSWVTASGPDDTEVLEVFISPGVQISTKTGDLLISNGLSNGTRFYKCRTTVPTGFVYSGYTQVTVLDSVPQNFEPYGLYIAKIPDFGLENEAVLIECMFEGRPTPTMTEASWTKVDGVFPTSRVTFSDYFTKMKISNLQPSDAGTYHCAPLGYAEKGMYISLDVKAAPRFDSEFDMPYSRNVTDGDTVTFTCNPYANPKASIKWFSNRIDLIPPNLPPRFSISADGTQLTIRDVCRECGGGVSYMMTIQCNASNEHGYIFTQGYLNILDRPTSPPSPTTTPVPSSTPGTVICHSCEGTAASSCGITVDPAEVTPLFCLSGYCATVTYTSVGNNTISRVIRSCGKSDCTSTSCATYGAEMMCVNICKQSFCNGDITSSLLN